jgi:hypothetical protein
MNSLIELLPVVDLAAVRSLHRLRVAFLGRLVLMPLHEPAP